MFMGPGFEKDLFCENIMIEIAFEMVIWRLVSSVYGRWI